MNLDEDGRFTDGGGYVVRTGDSFTEHYSNRSDIPDGYRIFAYPEPEKSIKKTLESYGKIISETVTAAHEHPNLPMRNDNTTSGQIGPKCERRLKPMAKAKTTTEPIMDNEHVKELLTILREHNSPSTKDFLSVLNQVGAMEKQLDAAVKELSAMRQELKIAQEQNHPVKTALQKAIIVTQGQVLDLRDKLAELKQNVIAGCRNAVAAFKETGISALDNVARFFKVRPILEAMRDMLTENIQYDDKAISKIEAISTEYHQAGRHLKNMGRTMLDRETVQEVKQPGKLAAVISAPFRAERSHFSSIKGHVEKSLNILARLEERAVEKKPSIREALATQNEKIAQAQKDAPTTERPHPANAEK